MSEVEVLPVGAIRLVVIERDLAIENLIDVTKVLREIYDSLISEEDWGDLGNIMDGSVVDRAGELLKKIERQHKLGGLWKIGGH